MGDLFGDYAPQYEMILFCSNGTKKLNGGRDSNIIKGNRTQNNRCYWCSTSIAKTYQIDHYEPLSKGGEHLIDNIVLACPHCNMSKGKKNPLNFANKLGRLL